MRPRLAFFVLLFGLLGCERSSAPSQQKAKRSTQDAGSASYSSSQLLRPPAGVIHAGLLSEAEGPKLIHYVRPVYPAWARQQHLEGVVEFQGRIGTDGRIRELTYMKGPQTLVPYAEAAVRQWRYRPTTIKGTAVEIVSSFLVQFTLHQ